MSNIITSSDLGTYMNKTLNAGVAGQVIAAVNAWIATRTHRAFGIDPGTVTAIVERHDCAQRIYLDHQDIISIDAVKLGYPGTTQTTMTAGNYIWNVRGKLSLGLLSNALAGQFGGSDYIEVTYKYGVATVPEDLKLAALGIAAGFYNWATQGQQDISESSVGSYRIQYRPSNRGGIADPASSVNDLNWSIVDSYRMPRV